jgi:hypothetical protein
MQALENYFFLIPKDYIVHPFMRINDIKYSFGKNVVKIMNNQIKYNHCSNIEYVVHIK